MSAWPLNVQYVGGELGVSWTDVVGVKGVRDAKESVSCDVSVREMVSSFRLQDVASMVMCLQGMSLVGRVLVR